METKYGDDDEYTRHIFEKATSASLKRNAMKSIFKKYLQFEQIKGNSSRQAYVRKRAAEFKEELDERKGNEIN